jgi:hypothetical protein
MVSPRTINSRLPSHSERLLPYHVRLLSEANIGSPRRAGLPRPNRRLEVCELRCSRSKADIQSRRNIGRFGPIATFRTAKKQGVLLPNRTIPLSDVVERGCLLSPRTALRAQCFFDKQADSSIRTPTEAKRGMISATIQLSGRAAGRYIWCHDL